MAEYLFFGINLGNIPKSKRRIPSLCSVKDCDSDAIWVKDLNLYLHGYGLKAITPSGAEEVVRGYHACKASDVYVGNSFDITIFPSRKVRDINRLTDALNNPSRIQKKLIEVGLEVELSEISLYAI